MARNPEAIRETLDGLVTPHARNRLLARGLSRGMVWRDGVVPPDGPEYAAWLTPDLLDFGYGVLALALELRDANRVREPAQRFVTDDAFTVAAEAIESAIRRGDPADPNQGRHLVVCAAALHLAGFAARSFSILPLTILDKNLATPERALGLLLRHEMTLLREHVVQWLVDVQHTDDVIAERLLDEEDPFDQDDAVFIAVAAEYHRAVGLADTALLFGDSTAYDNALTALAQVIQNSAVVGNVGLWWVGTLTLHLILDLWDQNLHARIPEGPRDDLPVDWARLRQDFITVLSARQPPKTNLWPSQLQAASRAFDVNDDLVIALPTSAGKTLIAELCILRSLADKKRVVYVTPLRALSAQVERVLSRTFVPIGASVSSLYGATGTTDIDMETLEEANIVVATPEKLDFALRQDPNVLNDVGLVVFDEGHMIGLGSREIRYEVLIQRLLRRPDATTRRIVCLSAMFNATDPYFVDFANWLRRDKPGDPVHVRWRPTRQRLATLDWDQRRRSARLNFLDEEEAFVPRFLEGQPPQKLRKKPFPNDDIEFCISAANAFARDGHNVLVYSPQKTQVEPLVREFRHMHKQGYLNHVSAPRPENLAVALAIGREWLGENHSAFEGLKIGVGTHHGTLPRPFLAAVENLLDNRQLPVVVASPTLAQGLDLACSVLVFRSLQRFNAEADKQIPISPSEFANVVGRAGRAYVDLDGIAVLPTFEAGWSRTQRHEIFKQLIDKSHGQRLVSGLAQLVLEIANRIATTLNVPSEGLTEYILNTQEMWSDPLLETVEWSTDDESISTLRDYVADLDVALLSLIEPLEASSDELAAILDEILRDSLWKRTLARFPNEFVVERELLLSRARWLWQHTSVEQRRACFYAGLGKESGLFLYNRLDELVGLLCALNASISNSDFDTTVAQAIAFTEIVTEEPYFFVKRPDDWKDVLTGWINGTAFGQILTGRKIRETQQAQSFINDGIIFRIVWAAEAVRAQATTIKHARADELGDGPALAFTHGVPSTPAALLCQIGFSSRTGAMFATQRLPSTFTNMSGLREWLVANHTILSRSDFWESEDHYLLWKDAQLSARTDLPRKWKHQELSRVPLWFGDQPPAGTSLRIIPRADRSAFVCTNDLSPIGSVDLPNGSDGSVLHASVDQTKNINIQFFGVT